MSDKLIGVRAGMDKFDLEMEQLYNTQRRVSKDCGSPLLRTLGFGHRTLGAKTHGKKIAIVGGAGRQNSKAISIALTRVVC